MSMPAWLIPTLRAALRVAVRLLRRYDAAHPQPALDLSQHLAGHVAFTPQEIAQPPGPFIALLDAKLDNLRTSLAIAYAQRTRGTRKLSELDIPR